MAYAGLITYWRARIDGCTERRLCIELSAVLATGKVNVYIHDCKPAIAGVSRDHLAMANM